ncbi:signal peptidase I, partial [Streptomyces sp. DT225]
MGSHGRHGAPAADQGPRSLPTRAERRKLARKVKRKRRGSAVREIPLLITVALPIALVRQT